MAHPILDADEKSPYGAQSKDEFYRKHRVSHRERFMINKQKMKIFTQSWQPVDSTSSPKGVVGMIHGYTSESGWVSELTAVAIAKAGFFVYGLDLRGHGLSEGPRDHIPDVNPLLQDCVDYFDSVGADHPKLPRFLYGESLGAAISILLCLKQKTTWRGLVLIGAMCEISKKIKPIWPLEKFLPAAALVAPNWRISITSPPASRSYKESWKRKLVERSPNLRTCGRATAATALQLLRVADYIHRNCHQLEVPMLILHGGDDLICDPQGAKYLFKTASSKDKTLRIYPEMWHQLIGEPNEFVQQVFDAMLAWIDVRADLTITK